LGFTQDSLQPDEKIVAVGVLPKDFIASDTLARDLVQNTLGIDAGSARHGCQALHQFSNVTHKSMTPIQPQIFFGLESCQLYM
jgi:hypothetical protein